MSIFKIARQIFIRNSLILLMASFCFSQAQPYLKLSARDYPGYSRVIIESSVPLSSAIEKSGSLLLVKIRADESFRIQRGPFSSRFIKSIGWSKGSDFYMVTVKTTLNDFSYDTFRTPSPPQIVIDIALGSQKSIHNVSNEEALKPTRNEAENSESMHPASSSPFPPPPPPPASILHAAPGIRTIVVDPGHGGLETGAKGKFGTQEKDITLPISLKLKRIIERNLAFRVVLTRDKDIDVSLDNRAAIANNNRAYLFISIHTNSSFRKEALGSEVFFLSLNATDEEARKLAYLENNSSELERKITSDDENDIKIILWDMAQAAYLKQSSQLAESVQKELNSLLGTKNRGIKQAPFKVLTGVACPAVLVEVAFISNPEEEKNLLSEEFQNNVVRAIYQGLSDFLKIYSQE